MRQQMEQLPYFLDRDRRVTVLDALREVSLAPRVEYLGGTCANHDVHVVVDADVRPEKVMNAFKSYASRGLNRLGIDGPDRRRWARHGSTRWLWKDADVQEAIRYVVAGQGEPMEVYLGDLL
jgi:REP element-mobilizing transposase RayT